MNTLPLTDVQLSAVARTMLSLGMMHFVEQPPAPQPIAGREAESRLAELGAPNIVLDDELRAFVKAREAFLAWHPNQPVSISAHKLEAPEWLITAKEATAALAVLDRVQAKVLRSVLNMNFAPGEVDRETWDDWIKVLQGSGHSGFPIHIRDSADPETFTVAELLLDRDYLNL
ncbi:hypothetical protein [Streptacidiphilus sp. EB103A]|uniref:hypothetical protein n=1 Tax=Streptacidiphilus sp. EB103A TaxID=3156275 RepID=UPI003512A87F